MPNRRTQLSGAKDGANCKAEGAPDGRMEAGKESAMRRLRRGENDASVLATPSDVGVQAAGTAVARGEQERRMGGEAGGVGESERTPARGMGDAAGSGGAEERATRAALEKAEAEKRLQEAEQRLRNAVEELYNKYHKRSDLYSAFFEARHPLCHHGDSCVANAVASLCQSFLLAYSVRVGVGVLLRAFKLMRHRSFRSVLDLQLLLSEKNLIVREEAVRNGLLFGGFAGLYHAMRCILRRCLDRDTPSHSFIAGAVSGLSLFALDDRTKRRSLALYLLARLGQSFVNSDSTKRVLAPRLPRWAISHAGTLLFCLSSAQIMYSFVMRPETLPHSYFDFIVKTGPISAPVVEAVRRSNRGLPVNSIPLAAILRGAKGHTAPTGLGPHPPIIPCSLIHAHSPSCVTNQLLVMRNTFRKTFPLYLSLTFVPFVVLNLQKFMHSPLRTAWHAFRSAVRSTSFIALFVGIYQAAICMHRNVALKDSKYVYWFAGALSGLSALVEKPSRRTELALYTLPRAADSLWHILVNVHILPDIKHSEAALFCLCLGGLTYYYENEPSTMAPFLRGILQRFLKGTGSPSHTDNNQPTPPPAVGEPSQSLQASSGHGLPAPAPGTAGAEGIGSASVKQPPEGPQSGGRSVDWNDTAQRLEAAFQGL